MIFATFGQTVDNDHNFVEFHYKFGMYREYQEATKVNFVYGLIRNGIAPMKLLWSALLLIYCANWSVAAQAGLSLNTGNNTNSVAFSSPVAVGDSANISVGVLIPLLMEY